MASLLEETVSANVRPPVDVTPTEFLTPAKVRLAALILIVQYCFLM